MLGQGNDLAAGMDAAVGASSAGYLYGPAEEPLERRLENPGNGARSGLPLKSGKVGAVVFDGEAQFSQNPARRSSACAAAKSRANFLSCIIT